MLAYHNDASVKERLLARALAHQQEHHFVQNYSYWRDGKGSALGALAQKAKAPALHLQREAHIPEPLGLLMDEIFERLPVSKYEQFPHRFIKAIKVGADLSLVVSYFFTWLLSEELPKYFNTKQFPEIERAGKRTIGLYERKLTGNNPANTYEWADLGRETSRMMSQATLTAAYSKDYDTLAAARAAQTVNYIARAQSSTMSAMHVITCAANCGVNIELLADRLIKIVKSLEQGMIHPQLALVEGKPLLRKFLESLK